MNLVHCLFGQIRGVSIFILASGRVGTVRVKRARGPVWSQESSNRLLLKLDCTLVESTALFATVHCGGAHFTRIDSVAANPAQRKPSTCFH